MDRVHEFRTRNTHTGLVIGCPARIGKPDGEVGIGCCVTGEGGKLDLQSFFYRGARFRTRISNTDREHGSGSRISNTDFEHGSGSRISNTDREAGWGGRNREVGNWRR